MKTGSVYVVRSEGAIVSYHATLNGAMKRGDEWKEVEREDGEPREWISGTRKLQIRIREEALWE